MKKLLVLSLAIVMLFAMATTCFAAELPANKTQDVTATYNATDNTTVVYGVDVAWTDLEFTYSYGKGWNTTTHQYADAETGSWTDAEGTVTVTNHSNAAIKATVTYAGANGVTATVSNSGVLNLGSAATGNAAVSDSVTITVTGTPADLTNTTIGTVTVAFSAAD